MEPKAYLFTLLNEINWLEKIINHVIGTYLQYEGVEQKKWTEILPPNLEDVEGPYAEIVKQWELSIYERLAIALAMTPHLRPETLDVFFAKNRVYDRGFTEFGGVIDKAHSGFLPTGQTLLFLTSANNPELRLEVIDIFSSANRIMKEQLFSLSDTKDYIAVYNGILSISNRWLYYFIYGISPKIEQSSIFPAKQISTSLEWEDIVLSDSVLEQVIEIKAWLDHGDTLMNDWELYKRIKPGYRALFYGPPGTGKTLTATLLGKVSNREVYRVDLSMIVSNYIGETEKNLARIFDIAEHKDWILFFDEADALFGKRTSIKSSNDRHTNQQVAYLLQRIEDFPGVIILATSLRSNLDDSFMRRFQSLIHFKMPGADERYILWQKAFSGELKLDTKIDLLKVAKDYELSGGSIMNILRSCALLAVRKADSIVTEKELISAIRREISNIQGD